MLSLKYQVKTSSNSTKISVLRESDHVQYVITHLTFRWQNHLMASMKYGAHYVKQRTQMKKALLQILQLTRNA